MVDVTGCAEPVNLLVGTSHDVGEEGVPQIVCKSKIFATKVYGLAYNLHSELVAKIKNGWQTYHFYW